MPVTPDHQGSADEDQQVATWTRMLQAGTLTEAGYLAMVTAWARATFEWQWQQEGVRCQRALLESVCTNS